MIKLDVPDFCSSCPEFEPDVDKIILSNDDFFGNRHIRTNTTVTCMHRGRCLSMMDYIIDQSKKKENNNK